MSFGGIQAVILIIAIVVGMMGISKWGWPPWSLVVLIMVTSILLKSIKVKKKAE